MEVPDTYIFLPVIVQMLLVVVLYFVLGKVKSKEAAAGNVDAKRRGLYDDAWPASVQKINNCIKNQFEVPVLFYLLVMVIWNLAALNIFVHIVAWAFVASRLVHAYIHIGSNHVPSRRKVFILGLLMLLALMVYIALTVLI